MRRRRAVVLFSAALVCLAVIVAFLFFQRSPWPRSRAAATEIRVDAFAACDGTQPANEALVQALTAARGGTLVVPARCRLLLASPGPDAPAVIIPTHTTVRFENHTAALVLARRYCAGGPFVGAACVADRECRGGTCSCDVGSGPDCAFAPILDRTYTVVAAAPGSQDIVIESLRVDARGFEPYRRCVAGSDAQLPCRSASDCADGTCTGEPGSPVGPGNVDILDLSNTETKMNQTVTGAIVDKVWLYDHHRGHFSIKTGPRSTVRGSNNRLRSSVGFAKWIRVDAALDASPDNQIQRNLLQGWKVGVRLAGRSSMGDNDVSAIADGSANVAGYAVVAAGNQNRIANNSLIGFNCLRIDPLTGANITFIGNRCFSGPGAKIVIAGAGIHIEGNYLAWGSGHGGLCAAGVNVHRPCRVVDDCGSAAQCDDGTCNAGERRGSPCDCPDSTCRPDPVIWINTPEDLAATGVSHLQLENNLIHSNVPTSLVRLADTGTRCLSGSNEGRQCTIEHNCGPHGHCREGSCSDGSRADMPCDCPGGSCEVVTVTASYIAGNNFYAPLDVPVIDLGELRSGGTKIAGLSILNNRFSVAGTCIIMPRDASLASNVGILGNDFSDCRSALSGWDWRMGNLLFNAPLDAPSASSSGEAVQVAWLTNGDDRDATPGDVVEISPTTPYAFRRARGTSESIPVGIVLDAPPSGGTGKIATAGTTSCNVVGTVRTGTPLRVSDTPGAGSPAAAGESAYAVALEPGDGRVKCLVRASR